MAKNEKLLNINKATRLRFTYEDDLVFLKEVINQNPFNNTQGWENIQKNVSLQTGKNFLIKTLKQHLMLLLEFWVKKVKRDETRSGIEEPVTEKNVLLQEVSIIWNEYNYASKRKKRSVPEEQQMCELGKKAKIEFAEVIQEKDYYDTDRTVQDEYFPISNDLEGPSKINHTDEAPKKNAFVCLTEEHDKSSSIRIKELELEERRVFIEERKVTVEERRIELEEQKLKLEEKRIDIDYKERLQKLEIEKMKTELSLQERKISNQLLQSQQLLIENLLKNK